MPVILRYFWFIGAAFMAINIVIWRRRLLAVVDRGVASRVEVDHFTKWAAVWFVGGPLVAGLIALAAGWSTPLCAGMLSFDDVPRSLMSILSIASWVGLLWWVWRVGPALARRQSATRQFSPALIRVGLTAIVLLSGVGSAVMWRVMPRDP